MNCSKVLGFLLLSFLLGCGDRGKGEGKDGSNSENLAKAVNLTANQTYPENTVVKSAELGVFMTVPEGWEGVSGHANNFSLRNKQNPNQIIQVLVRNVGLESIEKDLHKGVELPDGTPLELQRPLQKSSNQISASYSLKSRSEQLFMVAKSGEFSTTVILIGGTDKRGQGLTVEDIEKVARSIGFFDPSSTPQDEGQIVETLFDPRGIKLTYYKTDTTGYSEKETIFLCADKTYFRRFQSSSAGITSGHFRTSDSGKWQMSGSQLTLTEADGKSRTIVFRMEGVKMLAGKRRYFREKFQGSCQ